jgi:ubiquinone/menaquinone biosynthesis C-methylase UbiE
VSVEWQLEGSAAELYERLVVPTMTGMWAAGLVARAGVAPGERVLDVACGTGVVARTAADRVGEDGRVAALDLNPDMLAVARSIPGATIDWHQGSALALPFENGSFDVVLCQLGLQFFPDRPAALAEAHRVLAPGGRVGLSVYGAMERYPPTQALVASLERHGRAEAAAVKRAEHALADADDLRALVRGAGFDDVAIETVEKTVRLPSVTDYVRIQLEATPVGVSAGDLFDVLVDELGVALAPYVREDGLAFPQQMHVALAHVSARVDGS